MISRSIFVAVLSLIAVSGLGCNTYHPLQVFVRDAETGRPIDHANVQVHHGYYLNPFPPKDDSAMTDAEGHATLSVAEHYGFQLATTAPQYLAMYSTSFYDAQARDTHEVRLYQEPMPSFEIVVPNDFRGIVRIGVLLVPDAKGEKGQRHFVAHVPSTGKTQIDVTPLFHDGFYSAEPQVRFENGQKVPDTDNCPPNAADVQVRYAYSARDLGWIYIIGNDAERERFKAQVDSWKLR